MKKVFLVLLTAGLLAAMSACGDSAPKVTEETKSECVEQADHKCSNDSAKCCHKKDSTACCHKHDSMAAPVEEQPQQ